jgi:hypothetical protein
LCARVPGTLTSDAPVVGAPELFGSATAADAALFAGLASKASPSEHEALDACLRQTALEQCGYVSGGAGRGGVGCGGMVRGGTGWGGVGWGVAG